MATKTPLQQYHEMLDKLEKLKQELLDYTAENVKSSDADGDWVLFEETDETAIEMGEQIEQLENEIDKCEDYLKEHGAEPDYDEGHY